ncbi:MAG: hypothetical protein HC877_22245 [Thioploca sp.]|nr:hypothetical protein [Thioploca sp.]
MVDLLDEKEANLVNQQLQSLLSKAQAGEEVDIDIRDLLGDYPATQKWMEKWLKGISSIEKGKGYSPLPGDHTPPPVDNDDDPKPK